jgi:hypothetical protein
MKKFVTLATAGIFLLSLQGARAQKEVEPPAVPPMLEGQRPLAQPETKESTAPKKLEEEKAKSKAKARGKQAKNGQKAQKKAKVKKTDKKKPARVTKKKSSKSTKKQQPAVEPMAGPEED